MRKGTWFLLTFVAGVFIGGSINLFNTDRAQAQPASGVKWQHKFFLINTGGGFGAGGAENEKTLKEINDGGWEYSGYTPNSGAGLSYPLFKRQKQ